MGRRLLLACCALAGLSALSCSDDKSPTQGPTTHTLTLVNSIISVPAEDWRTTQVNITYTMQNPRISGSFTASGGSGNDIKVLVMNEADYTNWSNGHSVTPRYNSGQLTTATYNVDLAVGTYRVVYDNSFSTLTSKNVTTRVDLSWEE
jgi:hypothetical protein